MSWTRQNDGHWRRSDGVRVLYDPHQLNNYRVVTAHGTTMMQSHAHRLSTVQRYKTPEFAMAAADRRWPLKTERQVG